LTIQMRSIGQALAITTLVLAVMAAGGIVGDAVGTARSSGSQAATQVVGSQPFAAFRASEHQGSTENADAAADLAGFRAAEHQGSTQNPDLKGAIDGPFHASEHEGSSENTLVP
jgi:hypothetical protein